ncbi:MAG: hypothetical protein FWE34_08525 [Defluviitaleaceae bacterium]|nr:hypothetical protein [Defluviitaleaceae bacterium]
MKKLRRVTAGLMSFVMAAMLFTAMPLFGDYGYGSLSGDYGVMATRIDGEPSPPPG